MSLPLPPGLTPSEVSFLCEMESVTIIPRQRLESVELLGGTTPPLHPPQTAVLPLWLALLLRHQSRANIVPPPWLSPSALHQILEYETNISPHAFSPPPPFPATTNPTTNTSTAPISPPFLPSSLSTAPGQYLPYHFLELSHLLLQHASEDIPEADTIRRLLRDLREVRMAKMRDSAGVLAGEGVVSLTGVGGLEVSEYRGFVGGVVEGLRKIGAAREQARKEREEEGGSEDSVDEDRDAEGREEGDRMEL
ncbi:MAG: DNA replication protein psf2 [Vezdaea acicularis]|nr:MAG: DNA replication protein psf2 [Vezdaea acicularis]